MSTKLTNVLLTLAAAGAALAAMAIADPYEASAEPPTQTVDVTVPVCAEEDCSDQPHQLGVWFDPDTNTPWLSLGETSIRLER